MNPVFAEGAALASPLGKILAVMRDCERSHIVLCVADDETVRNEAMAELGERLSGLYGFAELDYADPPMPSLPRYYRRLAGNAPVCVFAYGLELLRATDAEGYREALHFLNAHREDLRLAPGAVLLWLTTPALGDVLEQAPDFADWQTAGATFALPPGRQIERTALGRLSITEAEELRRQIRRCEEMLARPNLGSALTAELKKQLDTGERRLGRVADVRRDYRLHLVDELREHVMRGFAPQVGGRVLSLPLAKIFLPLKALEGRPALAEYAADDLRWQEAAEDLDELGWQQRREEMEKRYAQLQARQSAQRTLGLQELLKERRAVLLGDPGTGKTTMARYVAYALAADDLIHVGEAVRGLLPVLVRLADFGEALRADRELTLPDYVESRLMPQPAFGACLREAIEGSECLVILDGLDEVTDPDLRIEVTARIQALVSAFGGNRFLVTSRIVGYERSPLTRNFKHATLQELEADDKERFVELWYGAIRSEIHDRSLAAGEAELTEALQKKPQIARMAANPLLLTIMVLMHWRGVKLPSRRVQVYQNATDTLIEYWTAERVELDAEEVKQILAPIAHYILSSNVAGVIAKRDLLPRIRAGIVDQRGCSAEEAERLGEELLGLLAEQSGIFLERGFDAEHQPVYGFLHQTFAEYLAALHLAGEVLGGSFEIERYIHRSAWHEPLLLLAGHLSLFSQAHASRLLRWILDFPCSYEEILRRNVLLAADCLADDIQVAPSLRDETLEKLADLLVNPASKVREAAVEVCQRLARTRHRAPASAAVGELLDLPAFANLDVAHSRNVLSLATALVRLGERDAARPLISALGRYNENDARRLRFEGWPERAEDFLIQWIEVEHARARVGPDLASCHLGPLSAERVRQALGVEAFLELLDQFVARVPVSYKKSFFQWMLALASETPTREKILPLTTSENPSDLRLLAATHLLATEHRATGIAVLQELSSEDSLEATEKLAEADATAALDWSRMSDAAFQVDYRTPAAIRLLLRSGRIEIALSAAFHLLATYWGDAIVFSSDRFLSVVEDLIAAGRSAVALAIARWLSLRPGYRSRFRACEVLLGSGQIEEAIRLLELVAYECHGEESQLACERLLALNESDIALPILLQLAESVSPDLRHQASLALALTHRTPESEPKASRIELKTSILEKRQEAYRASLEELYEIGMGALGESEPAARQVAGIINLGRISLSWLCNRGSLPGLTADLPEGIDGISPTIGVNLALLELRGGHVDRARNRLARLAGSSSKDSDLWPRFRALEILGRIHCRESFITLTRALEDPHRGVRVTAAQALGNFSLKDTAGILLTALGDRDAMVRKAAAESVGKIRDPTMCQPVIILLHDESSDVRSRAVAALGSIGIPEAVQALAGAYRDQDKLVRRAVVEALGQLRDPAVTQTLITALNDASSEVRLKAAEALGRMRNPSALHALTIALAQGESVLRRAAAEALGRIEDLNACGALIRALGDENESVARMATTALPRLPGQGVTHSLIAAFNDGDTKVRRNIVLVLGRREDPAAILTLMQALGDQDSHVRAAAAEAVGQLGDPTAKRALLALLEDEAGKVRGEAARALARLPGPFPTDALLAVADDEDPNVRSAAIESLGQCQSPATARALISALSDEDVGVRQVAAIFLGRIRETAAIHPLIALLGDQSRFARWRGGEALGRLPGVAAIRPLIASLNDSDAVMRATAAGALARLREPGAVEPLMHALNDREIYVRRAAAVTLGRYRDPTAIPPLMATAVQTLMDRSQSRTSQHRDAISLVQALARLKAAEAVPLLVAIALPEPGYVKALIHLDAGKALKVLDRFAVRLRDESWPHRLRGHALCRLDDEDAALSAFQNALTHEGDNIENLLALVHFHLERDELHAAFRHLDRVPEKSEEPAITQLTRAVVHYRRGEIGKALESLEQARQADPDVTDAQELEFDHLWRREALAALQDLLVCAETSVAYSEVAEPQARYDGKP